MGISKHDLMAYRYIQLQIHQLDLEQERWYAKAERCTRSPSSVPAYGGSDPYPFIMDKLTSLGELAKHKHAELFDRRLRIEQAIETLDDRERSLLRARYIEGLQWEQIAVDMNYSIQRVWQVHGDALKRLEKIRD